MYLPLITTNCAVLGVAILNVDNGYNLLESTFNGFCAAAGFGLAMILFSCIRERLALANMPKWMNGFPGALISGGSDGDCVHGLRRLNRLRREGG